MNESSSEEIPNNATDANHDLYDELLSGTFVPMNFKKGTEQEIVRNAISKHQQPLHAHTQVPWPDVTNTPINEFKTEGYISCVFPALFPSGAADFTQPRLHTVTVGNYFKHLMMYKDGRALCKTP